jgi:beta-xylosidase
MVLGWMLGADEYPLRREEIQIRDPFVVPVAQEQRYYLYGTGAPKGALGFFAYASPDLEHWQGPFPVFQPNPDFWGKKEFWAPEVHRWRGKYYLFASAASATGHRGTQVFAADSPRGPFTPLGNAAQTPDDWMALDGTLFVDDAGAPWMVFCHEWVQTRDGEMSAMPLAEDLSKPLAPPKLLFHASDAKWPGTMGFGAPREGLITDGPNLYRLKNGDLLLLWSTFGQDKRYKVAMARSRGGKLDGPWEHEAKPFYEEDGGHPMIFHTFDGRLMLSLHRPNHRPERPVFLPVREENDTLVLGALP